jgi:hypothetical protein
LFWATGGCSFDAAGQLVSEGGDVRRKDLPEVLDVADVFAAPSFGKIDPPAVLPLHLL